MRTLYRLLLHLYPRTIKDQFGDEMLGVFDQASAQARGLGPIAYAQFCLREIAGLVFNVVHLEPIMKHKRLLLSCALAGLTLGSVVGIALQRRPYTSTAVVRSAPNMIGEGVIPKATAPMETARNIMQSKLSRGNLTTVINRFNLYPAERHRMPMEDVIEIMRQNIHLEFRAEEARIAFTYGDGMVAQKVAADLTGHLVSEWVRSRTAQALYGAEFLKRRAETAAREWDDRLAELRKAQKENRPLDRVRLDAEIARQRYENYANKAADAELQKSLEVEQLGSQLEVLDPASLPSEDRPPVYATAAAGLAIGLLLAWLITLVRRPARTIEVPA